MLLSKVLRLLRRTAPFVAGFLLLALLLRFIWRDTRSFSAPSFYALPLPLHLAGWLWLTGLWWRPQRWNALGSLAMAAFMALLWTVQTKRLCREIAAPSSPGPRVFFWNIGHTHAVPDALHELLTEFSPDIAAFAEAENLGSSGQTELRERHPGYEVKSLPLGMVCMVKGRAPMLTSRDLPQRSVVMLLTVKLTRFSGEWSVCLTDIGPLPPLPREPLLREVYNTAFGHPRTIILGDFNTPLDSAAFDPWRTSFHHGFADCSAFHGSLETWAFGLPILAIDHIWMSPDLVPVSAKKAPRRWQDHSWIMVDCGE
jgi:hypothetical protein